MRGRSKGALWFYMALIAPSLTAANSARLGEALEAVKVGGAAMIHVDVMDGHFVPEIAMGQPVIASLRRATDLILEAHLLIERPERFAEQFVDAGADRVAVHPEATPNFHRALDLVRKRGAKAGAALNPATPIESISDVLAGLDFVTVLSADPGLAEEEFIPASVAKVRAAARLRSDRRLSFAIEVEGGVTLETLEELTLAGADILVAGSAIFHRDNPVDRLAEMIRLAAGAHHLWKT